MAGSLHVQRPSPTTVSFTVSNASRRSNTPAKILFGLQILLRAILLCCVIFVAVARLRHYLFEKNSRIIHWQDVCLGPLASKVCHLADTYNPWVITAVSALVVYGVFRREYTGMDN